MENLKLKFNKLPPPPIPGLFYIEMAPKIDVKSHCSSLDLSFKSIHTPIAEMFPLDILEEMRALEGSKGEMWLRQGTHIDSVYYQEKSDRNELLMRDEQKHNIEDVLDYQKYLRETFSMVNEEIKKENIRTDGDIGEDMLEIVEEYPLFPSNDQFILVTGTVPDDEDSKGFVHEATETSLIDKCIINNRVYKSTKLHIEDKICIEVRNGKAYYSFIKYVYKFTNIEN